MVSWVNFGQKSLMNGFIGNTLMFYFIFVDGIQWNSDKKWWYSRVTLEIRTWKPVVVFIETRVFLVELKALALNSSKKNSVSMKPTHRFQVLTPKFHVKSCLWWFLAKKQLFSGLETGPQKKIPPKWVKKKNTTFGFKKSAETWTWNHFGFQKN